jgi:hypothetical protein
MIRQFSSIKVMKSGPGRLPKTCPHNELSAAKFSMRVLYPWENLRRRLEKDFGKFLEIEYFASFLCSLMNIRQ